MAPRDAVRALAIGRIALGVAMVLFPRLTASMWVGRDARSAGGSVLTRALGIRDVLIGGSVLHIADMPQVGRRWVRMCGVIDLVDGLATLAVRRELPRVPAALGATIAFGSASAHLQIAARMDGADADGDASGAGAGAAGAAREVVYPDGSKEAMRAMGARHIGTDVPGRGPEAGRPIMRDPDMPGGLQQ